MHEEVKCWVCICGAGAVTPVIQICKYWIFALGFWRLTDECLSLVCPSFMHNVGVVLARFACPHTTAHRPELIQYIVLHRPSLLTVHSSQCARSLLEMKLELVRLGRHLRCISERGKKDRTLLALHYRPEGPELRELLLSMSMEMVSTFVPVLALLYCCIYK